MAVFGLLFEFFNAFSECNVSVFYWWFLDGSIFWVHIFFDLKRILYNIVLEMKHETFFLKINIKIVPVN